MCEELILVSRERNIGAKFQRDTRQEIIDFFLPHPYINHL